MTLALRPYQTEALDTLFAYWAASPGNPLIVLPTGSGKSLVMASLTQRLLDGWPDMRIVSVTHVKELIAQNFEELCRLWNWAPAGIYSAGLGRRETQSQILFCGIQSVRDKAAQIGHVDVLLVDECHLIPRSAETSYGQFIADLRAINPDLKIVGLTATPYRLDSGRLDEGTKDGPALFDGVAYEAKIRDLIDGGFLAPLISKATATAFDVSGVHKRGGEFIAGELEAAVNRGDVTRSAVGEIIAYGRDREAWLVFCAGVDHAIAVSDELRRQGVNAGYVHGGMTVAQRDGAIGAFRRGELRALTNANILTTGFNVPQVDLLAMLRPTMSTSLYVQMVGRGSRTAPGKTNCLVLDFAGNVTRHGPVDDVKPRKPGEGGGDAPIRICPECASIMAAAKRVCDDCGYEFPIDPEPKHAATADTAPILSGEKPEWLPVRRRTFYRHEKPGGIPTVRVEFTVGLATVHKMWLCPEHEGYARRKFIRFWVDHLPDGVVDQYPNDVDGALSKVSSLRPTTQILVRPAGKYFEVVGYKPSPEQDEEAA